MTGNKIILTPQEAIGEDEINLFDLLLVLARKNI